MRSTPLSASTVGCLPAKRTYNITALQRGLRLLDLFATAERGLTATELARQSRLPVSTVHRFLVNLEASGFLTYSSSGTYHLGVACFSLGQAALGQFDIRRISLRHLQNLNQQTRETVHLTVRHGLSVVYVDKLDSPEPLRIHSRIGASVPLYCTAVGKVLLAYLPEAKRESVLVQLELERFTPNTIRSLHDMRTRLQNVRRAGYACDIEEHELHIRCVAAPIWDHTGTVTASLSITAPALRMPVTRLRQLAPLIQEAGRAISRELGYSFDQSGSDAPVPAKRAVTPASPPVL